MVAQNADIFVQAQIQKRLPLYSEQKEKLDKDVNKFLNEQKAFAREAIPVITSLELDVSKVDQKYDYLNSLYQKLALNFAKLMSKYMAPLDDKQQKDFEKTLKIENQALSRSSAESRLEKVTDRFETLFGFISEKQQKILAAQKNYFAERHKVRVSRREKLHDRFMEIYKMDVSQETRSNYFYEAFAEYQKNYPENAKNKEIIKSIIPTLSAGQKEIFEDKVNDLKEIINYYLEAHF